MTCDCGLPEPYASCCGRFHAGTSAPTAELLMRSRYTAFARGDVPYLLATWHPTARPPRLVLDRTVRWTGLDVTAVSAGGLFDRTGTVAFTAQFTVGRRDETMHEVSRFSRAPEVDDGRWLYVGPVA